MKRILLIVNPSSRRGLRRYGEIKQHLEERGHFIVNSEMSDLPKAATEIPGCIFRFKDRTDVVVIGGGDGTINAALPALIETGLPLLVIPLGTANNLARTLQLPGPAEQALQLLAQGWVGKVDVGLVNGIPFLNVVGLGLSTQVNRMVRSRLKRWFGVFAFVWTAMKVALRMTPFRVVIECDGRRHEGRSWQVTVCNGKSYGSGLTIDSAATLEDQTLHGISTELTGWRHLPSLIPSLLRGRYAQRSDVVVFQGARMRVRTAKPMRVDVDGEVKTHTPLEISVAPLALNMFLPSSAAQAEADAGRLSASRPEAVRRGPDLSL